tara:strand:- start:75 stop:485 length:411 start_codon:yes stop_codon:yes gene_type:complete
LQFYFDTDAMAAAFGGDKNWPGTYVCHALRTGVTGPVTFEKSSSSSSSSKKGVRFLFAKMKTSDDVNDDESDPLGVGSFVEKDANDWRVGDILLLEKKIAKGEEDQLPQKGSDAWLEINFPEPKKKTTKMEEYPTV